VQGFVRDRRPVTRDDVGESRGILYSAPRDSVDAQAAYYSCLEKIRRSTRDAILRFSLEQDMRTRRSDAWHVQTDFQRVRPPRANDGPHGIERKRHGSFAHKLYVRASLQPRERPDVCTPLAQTRV